MKIATTLAIALLGATICFFTGCGESEPEPVTKASALIAGERCHGEIVLSEESASAVDVLNSFIDIKGLRKGYNKELNYFLTIRTRSTDSPASSVQELKVVNLMKTLERFITSRKKADFSDQEFIYKDRETGIETTAKTLSSTAKETFGEMTVLITKNLTKIPTVQESGKRSMTKQFEAKWSLLLGEKEILTISSTDGSPPITFDKKIFSDGLSEEAVRMFLYENGIQVKPLYEALVIRKLTPSMRRKLESVKGEVAGTTLFTSFFPLLRGGGGPSIEYGAVYYFRETKPLVK